MTARECRIAELAAEDLEGWARELPLGSETRRDLQQTARAYRLAARGGTGVATLRAVPDTGVDEELGADTGHAGKQTSGGPAPAGFPLAGAPRALEPRDPGA